MNPKRASTPLISHLDQKLRPLYIGLPLVIAAVVGLVFACAGVLLKAEADRELLDAIRIHSSSLVESGDRPELQRLLHSAASSTGSELLVIQHGMIMASSRAVAELDTLFRAPGKIIPVSQSRVTSAGLYTEIPIRRKDGPQDLQANLVLISPLLTVVLGCLGLALGSFLCAVIIIRMVVTRLRSAVSEALSPVAELDRAIRDLKTLRDPGVLEPTAILELDNIRDAILETYRTLTETRDALAQSKAKEMTAEAYKRLIHDLHNPVAALRNLTKASNTGALSAEEQRELMILVRELAEQILNQVKVGKSHLALEEPVMSENDLRTCIEKAARQASLAVDPTKAVELRTRLPQSPVVCRYDSLLLGRAITNLVSNALDACRSAVEVQLEANPSQLRIRIVDDGAGMSQEKAGLYLQGREKSTKREGPAYGIATANHIVRAHGGRIIFNPADTGGACFEIRMPEFT